MYGVLSYRDSYLLVVESMSSPRDVVPSIIRMIGSDERGAWSISPYEVSTPNNSRRAPRADMTPEAMIPALSGLATQPRGPAKKKIRPTCIIALLPLQFEQR